MKVALFGHGDLAPSRYAVVEAALEKEVIKLFDEGVSEFWLGGYGDFDNLAEKLIYRLKNERAPHVKSVLVIPYPDREYFTEYVDETLYPPIEGTPRRYAILKRNEYMAANADLIIAHVEFTWGGAYKAVEHARKKGKKIILLD